LHVGTNPRVSGEGWVSSRDVFLTANMQWLSFNQDTQRARARIVGFSKREDLERFLNGENIPPDLVEYDLGNGYPTWMPVLDSRTMQLGSTNMQLLEIGAWTLQLNLRKKTTLDSADVRETMRQASIILCVDCTASTNPVWDALATKLKQIVEDSQKHQLEIKISIVAYRDNDKASIWPYKASSFTADVDQLQIWISRLQPRAGGDWPERMFEAMVVAANMLAQPEHNTAYKTILLVTDNEGHVDDKYPTIGSVGRQCIDLCQEHGITINTLQLPYHPKFDGDKDLLGKQLTELTRETNGQQFQFEGAYVQDQTAINLKELLGGANSQAQSEVKIAEDLQRGKTSREIQGRTGLPASVLEWRIKNVQRRMGRRMPVDQGTDLGVDSVWVAFDSHAMNMGVLMRQDELEALLKVFDRLLTRGVEKPESLAELWGTLVSSHIGEDVPLSEALRANGLPIRDNLLGITLSELIVMTRIQRKAWAVEVEKKYEALVAWKTANSDDGHGNFIVPFSVLP